MPMIFGAVHPITSGLYVTYMLVVFGGWLLLNPLETEKRKLSVSRAVPLIVLGYMCLQSIPLPIGLVEFLSPARAERADMVNSLAGIDQKFIAIGDGGVAGIYQAIFFLSLILYYHGLKRLFSLDRKMVYLLALCLIGVGTFEALYGLLQFLNPDIGILWLEIRRRAAHGTIIYRNQYATLLNMIWPLAVACAALYFIHSKDKHRHRVSKRTRRRKTEVGSGLRAHVPFFVFAAIAMMLAILFSLSRGAILAMLLVGACLVILLPFGLKIKLIALLFFMISLGGYGAFLGLDTLVGRFDTLGGSGAQRMDIYLSSLPMLRDHWLTGIGSGSYALLSPVYLKGFPPNVLYDSAHNEYLELMIELGVPMALLLFVWLAAGMLKMTRKALSTDSRSNTLRSQEVLGVAAVCGLTGLLVHGIVDFSWRLPVNMLYGVTLFAMASHGLSISSSSRVNAVGFLNEEAQTASLGESV